MTGARFAAGVLRTACLGFLFISTLDPAFAVSPDEKETAEECLKGPKGAPPAGERWRYRVERGTKRHCWYTRADGARKTAVPRVAAVKPVKDDKPLDAEPLQLSVANARAEADLSASPPAAEPQTAQIVTEPRNPAWTLAERWSQNADASPPVQAPSAPIGQPLKLTPAEPQDATGQDNGMIEMAAGTVALLGLSVALIATLMRRRKREWPVRDWPPARRDMDDEPNTLLTDLNDAPLMTWRKASQERLQIVRRAAELRDATSARTAQTIPTVSAGPRRMPTIPPGARA